MAEHIIEIFPMLYATTWPNFIKYFLCYMLLPDQISLSGCINFWDIGQNAYFTESLSLKQIKTFFLEWWKSDFKITTPAQQTFTCSKSTILTLEKGVKYVQIEQQKQ